MKPLAAAVAIAALSALPVFQQSASQAGVATGGSRDRTLVVPRQFGQFKAVLNDQLLFEDERGTIRSVYVGNGGVVFTVVRR
jgi:hypothetical protein